MTHRTWHRSTTQRAVSVALVLVFAGALAAAGASSAQAAVHTRREIHELTDPQIDAYRKGVALMKTRGPSDPTSWST